MEMINCWDFMKCGRELGASNVADISVCPAAVEKDLDGINGGKNAGRVCWATAGTLCKGQVQGTFASKLRTCLVCDFYKVVRKEEGQNFKGFEINLLSTWFS